MGRFSSVVDAQDSTRGSYMPWLDAKLRVKILGCKFIDKPAFIVAFTVLEILAAPSEAADPEGKPFPAVGVDKDWYVKMSPIAGGGNPGATDVKKFAIAASPDIAEHYSKIADLEAESKPDLNAIKELYDQAEELLEYLVSDANPLEGTEMILDTQARFQRNKSPFTGHVWTTPKAA